MGEREAGKKMLKICGHHQGWRAVLHHIFFHPAIKARSLVEAWGHKLINRRLKWAKEVQKEASDDSHCASFTKEPSSNQAPKAMQQLACDTLTRSTLLSHQGAPSCITHKLSPSSPPLKELDAPLERDAQQLIVATSFLSSLKELAVQEPIARLALDLSSYDDLLFAPFALIAKKSTAPASSGELQQVRCDHEVLHQPLHLLLLKLGEEDFLLFSLPPELKRQFDFVFDPQASCALIVRQHAPYEETQHCALDGDSQEETLPLLRIDRGTLGALQSPLQEALQETVLSNSQERGIEASSPSFPAELKEKSEEVPYHFATIALPSLSTSSCLDALWLFINHVALPDYCMIDSRWVDQKEGTLCSLDASKAVFPQGLAPSLKKIRSLGMARIGLVVPLLENIPKAKEELHSSSSLLERARAFYERWLSYLHDQGVDFVHFTPPFPPGLPLKEFSEQDSYMFDTILQGAFQAANAIFPSAPQLCRSLPPAHSQEQQKGETERENKLLEQLMLTSSSKTIDHEPFDLSLLHIPLYRRLFGLLPQTRPLCFTPSSLEELVEKEELAMLLRSAPFAPRSNSLSSSDLFFHHARKERPLIFFLSHQDPSGLAIKTTPQESFDPLLPPTREILLSNPSYRPIPLFPLALKAHPAFASLNEGEFWVHSSKRGVLGKVHVEEEIEIELLAQEEELLRLTYLPREHQPGVPLILGALGLDGQIGQIHLRTLPAKGGEFHLWSDLRMPLALLDEQRVIVHALCDGMDIGMERRDDLLLIDLGAPALYEQVIEEHHYRITLKQ